MGGKDPGGASCQPSSPSPKAAPRGAQGQALSSQQESAGTRCGAQALWGMCARGLMNLVPDGSAPPPQDVLLPLSHILAV